MFIIQIKCIICRTICYSLIKNSPIYIYTPFLSLCLFLLKNLPFTIVMYWLVILIPSRKKRIYSFRLLVVLSYCYVITVVGFRIVTYLWLVCFPFRVIHCHYLWMRTYLVSFKFFVFLFFGSRGGHLDSISSSNVRQQFS